MMYTVLLTQFYLLLEGIFLPEPQWKSKTEKSAARESVKILRDNNVNILGCVFCGINSKRGSYYNSKYKYYYQNYYGKDVNPDAVKVTEPMKEEEDAPVMEEQPQEEEKKEN